MAPNNVPKKLRIMCLCGGFSNNNLFSVQLKPIMQELEDRCEFFFIEGDIVSEPPNDIGLFFGPPPNYCWVLSPTEVLRNNLRSPPGAMYPEDSMRMLLSKSEGKTGYGAHHALNRLFRIMETEGPFDGVLGYSEGAGVAATLLVNEPKRAAKMGRQPMLQCGIFFGGWPPMDVNLDGSCNREAFLLMDVVDQVIDVPTMHVIGSADPFLYGGLALYNVCDNDTARVYDHGKAHFIPREPDLVCEIADGIREMLDTLVDVAV